MYCGIRTNRKWNYGHVPVLPFIFVSCSLTIEEVGRHSFPLKQLFYFILFYFIFFCFIYFFKFFFLFFIIIFYFILFFYFTFYFLFFIFYFYFILFYFLVVFLLYNLKYSQVVFLHNVLRHTHKQEMELRTCVCTSFHFCQLFTDH